MAGGEKREALILDAMDGMRLDKAAAQLFDHLTRTRLKSLIEEGALTLGDGPNAALMAPSLTLTPKTKVRAGQTLTLREPEVADLTLVAEAIPLDIVFEDAHLLVLNKPAGLVVHPGAGNKRGTLVNALLHHCGDTLPGIGGQRRPGIVHRLDKDTSGLIVVAKDEQSLTHLQAQFQQRTIDRHYRALIWGLVPTADGVIDAPLGRHPRDRLKMTVRQDGREAITTFEMVEAFATFACQVECRLKTGRTHQIRVHFDHCGYPLMGDPLYGSPKKRLMADAPPAALAAIAALPGQALHAAELGFEHPITGARLHFEQAPPPAFESLVAALRTFRAGFS